jgi:hypothetical protein
MLFSNARERLCNTCDAKLWDNERETCRRCRKDPYPLDTFLRRAGFKIHSRPRRGTTYWEIDGKCYDYTDAQRLAQIRLMVIFPQRG